MLLLFVAASSGCALHCPIQSILNTVLAYPQPSFALEITSTTLHFFSLLFTSQATAKAHLQTWQ